MSLEFICSSKEELYQKVAKRCGMLLEADLKNRGVASINVPGGTTPAPVFELLSKMPLSWSKISVLPTDERWIDVEHQQSNQYLIKQTLLINEASGAKFVGLKNDSVTPAEGETEISRILDKVSKPSTVTVIGMGMDGHVASLFPNTPQIAEALDLDNSNSCIGINAEGCSVAGDYTQRMSQTLASLIDSQLVIILITGDSKLNVLRAANHQKDFTSQPVAALLAQTKTPVEIYWA